VDVEAARRRFDFYRRKGVIRKRDPQGERILFENRPAGRGVFDVGYQFKEGRLVTLSDRADGCLILQVWSGKTGSLLRSELVYWGTRYYGGAPYFGERR